MKVDGSLDGYIFQLAHFKQAISVRQLANPNGGCSHFSHYFGS